MKISVLCVGKKHDALFVDAINEFEKRLGHYCSFSWHLIASSDKEKESRQILARIKDDMHVMLLDERGTQFTTIEFSDYLERLQNTSTRELAIVIGGAYGVDEQIYKRADDTVALSRLVFPHQLVRLILVEQLYRSYDLLAGGKYHHD